MRVPVKLLGFGIWLLSLHCARCQECLREDIKYENTEPVEKPSYADGDTLKINCMTGYTGLYKLKCEKGEWKKSIERHCAKKKCSHPGDTPNGDFKLTEGTEFVFGATVVYTCRKGYEMASRISQRTCRAQGWDNAVPLCEVVKCPAIRTDGDVTATGNTEEGSYGDVIHFECVSPEKMIAGSSDIHCKDTGKWSDDVPKCKDITCTAPGIPNGEVVEQIPGMSEYKKGAILEYKCKPRFKKREGIPRCAKFGWTIKPECDEVTCELKSATFGIEKIKPKGKTIFRAGESVEITCSEKYAIFFTQETSKSFTCKDNGKWDQTPECAEIRCEVPRGQHVYLPQYYFRGDKKLGTKYDYHCESGYDKMEEEATCTKDGWTPNPLCAKMCAAPNIPSADIVEGKSATSKYQIFSTIKYKCHPGFEPEEPVKITCNSWAQWIDIRQCTDKMCAAPNILNAMIVEGERSSYKKNSRIKYKCYPGFEPEQPLEVTCDLSAQWTVIQKCTVKQELCPAPSVENGFKYIQPSNKEKIFYSCNRDYKPFSGKWWDLVTCNKGLWSDEPRCIPKEECGALPSVHHGKLKQTKQTFHDGNTTEFKCDPGFISTSGSIKCTNGTWEKPVCKEGVHCGIPPKVENAVITSKPEDFYVDGSNVTYVCRNSFLIRGESMVFCHNGTWEETPTCQEVTCELKSTTSEVKKIKPEGEKKFRAGESVEITCSEKGWTSTKETSKSFTCLDNGEWDYEPVCQGQDSGKCGKPPHVNDGDTKDMTANEYNTGDRVEYKCFDRYTLDLQPPFSRYLTCENGQWSGDIKCLKPCTVTQEIMDKSGIELAYSDKQKMFAPHDDHITFKCQGDKFSKDTDLRRKCNDGNMSFPVCV